jgi:hypothetical protein
MEDNIKMDLKAVELDGVNWIYLAQDRDKWQTVANMVIKFSVF